MGWIHGDEGSYVMGFGSNPEPTKPNLELIEQEQAWKDAVNKARQDFKVNQELENKSWMAVFKENPEFLQWLSNRAGERIGVSAFRKINPEVLLDEFIEFKGVKLPDYSDFVKVDCEEF